MKTALVENAGQFVYYFNKVGAIQLVKSAKGDAKDGEPTVRIKLEQSGLLKGCVALEVLHGRQH